MQCSEGRKGTEMQLLWLILCSVFLPALWGWSIHWLVERVWPAADPSGETSPRVERFPPPPDYQI